MRFSKPRSTESVRAQDGEAPEVFFAGQVLIDAKQTPFALIAMAFTQVSFGAILAVHSLYGLGSGAGGSLQVPTLVVGGVELIVGGALLLGRRWAFRATRVLIPADLVASIVLFALNPAASLLFVIAVFGFTVFMLYGPGTFAGASQIRLRTWLRGSAERGADVLGAERVLEVRTAA